MGSPDPRAYSRNKRGIAGNLIWIQFDRHALLNLFHLGTAASRPTWTGTVRHSGLRNPRRTRRSPRPSFAMPVWRSVIPGLFVLGRNETLARTRASHNEAEAGPSDRSPGADRRQEPVSVGLRVESAFPVWLRYGAAGQPDGCEAGFPASSPAVSVRRQGNHWRMRMGLSSLLTPATLLRIQPRLAARATTERLSARVWWGQDSGR